jgi:methylated-DNA-protein-cysteine methyltransferase related protein
MSPASPPDSKVFYQQVWEVVREIPPGRVASYGQIAKLVPVPPGVQPETYRAFGARWVGSAMAACPADVPWQRVLNSKGEISVRAGAEHQRRLLEAEGVTFDAKGRVDLKQFGWEGPGSGSGQGRLF